MNRKYDNNFKSMIVRLIVDEHHSTSGTAQQFSIPLKTIEKWVTAYRKDTHCYNADYKSQTQIIAELKKSISKLERDNEILKKTIILLAKKE